MSSKARPRKNARASSRASLLASSIGGIVLCIPPADLAEFRRLLRSAYNEARSSQTPLPILRGSYGSQPDPLTIVQSAADALASTARARSRPAATGGKTPISRPGQAVGSSRSVPQSQRGRRQRAEQSQTTFPEA